MTTHIMLDLETWGKVPGSDIRSIGACVFDPLAGSVQMLGAGTFYIATENVAQISRRPMRDEIPADDGRFYISMEQYGDKFRKYPLVRDPDTVEWWSKQSAEAQAAFADPIDLRDALINFTAWLSDQIDPLPRDDNPSELRIWANGPDFDCSILAACYRACGLPLPWHYRAPRDFRTVCDLAGITREEMQKFSHGTTHNGLDDSISQAMIACEAYKRLGLCK